MNSVVFFIIGLVFVGGVHSRNCYQCDVSTSGKPDDCSKPKESACNMTAQGKPVAENDMGCGNQTDNGVLTVLHCISRDQVTTQKMAIDGCVDNTNEHICTCFGKDLCNFDGQSATTGTGSTGETTTGTTGTGPTGETTGTTGTGTGSTSSGSTTTTPTTTTTKNPKLTTVKKPITNTPKKPPQPKEGNSSSKDFSHLLIVLVVGAYCFAK